MKRIQFHRDRRAADSGSALVLSLVAVSMVVVLAASFSQLASAVASRQAQSVHKKRAFYMAEAGLAEAYVGFTQGKSGIVGSLEAPALLGDGLFWVEATELEPGIVRLESTGMVGTASAQLGLVVEREESSVSSLGVFSSGAVKVGEGSTIDAYDSTLGAYAAQSDKSGASLASNEGITVDGSIMAPTSIEGDVTPGTEDTLTTTGSVTISGDTKSALSTTTLPAVEVPELTLQGDQVQNSPYPMVIPSGRVGYQSLTVKSGTQVILQGPAKIVLGSLSLEGGAELAFDTSQGTIELYVTDALFLAPTSLLTNTGTQPEEVLIQIPGETVDAIRFDSTGPLYGVIYAPEAAVELGGSFELFGALVADSLVFDGAATLHFDKNLARLAAGEALPSMLSWRIIELASTSTDLSVDPFTFLGLNKNALLAPAISHMDQTLSIDYYDASSVYHRYVGPEINFDWNVVKTVISATRDGVEVIYPRSTTTKAGTKKSPGVLPIVDGPMI